MDCQSKINPDWIDGLVNQSIFLEGLRIGIGSKKKWIGAYAGNLYLANCLITFLLTNDQQFRFLDLQIVNRSCYKNESFGARVKQPLLLKALK